MVSISTGRIGGMTKGGVLWDGCIFNKKNNTSNVSQIVSELREAGVAVPMNPIKYVPKS